MTDYEKVLSDFVKALKSAKREYDFYYQRVGELDKAKNDILHQIELGNPKERNVWSTKLSATLKERRIAKDIVQLTEPIKKFIDENQKEIKTIERVLGDVRKEQNAMKTRKYSPKILNNLTIACWGREEQNGKDI